MTVTLNEMVELLKEKITDGLLGREVKTRLQVAATKEIHGVYINRIFKTGLAESGEIGEYSERPWFADLAELKDQGVPNLSRLGKPRTTKTGKQGVFLKGGYKELREKIGRPVDNVKLELTGNLRNSIQVGLEGADTKMGFTNQAELDIAEKNEEHFGKDIFTPRQSELNRAGKAAQKEAEVIIKGLFG